MLAHAWLLLCLSLADASSAAVAVPAPAPEQVRIAVGRFRDVVTIRGVGMSVLWPDGKRTPGNHELQIRVSSAGLKLNGEKPIKGTLRIVAPGVLGLSGHSYRRELEVGFQLYDKKNPEVLVVHPLDLETYVTGIVSAELPGGWPLGAYQAQAVAARTFALFQKYRRLDLPYHMESSVLDQVYAGVEREHPLAQQAAASTRGEVLTFDRHLVQAFFHAACGGETESALEGWGAPLRYLPGSNCGRCQDATRSRWSAQIAKAEVDRAFSRVLGEPVTSLQVAERSPSGRVRAVQVRGAGRSVRVTGADVRRLLGYTRVWSTLIDRLELGKDGLRIAGRGSGHGVGMCQWGARGLAQTGVPYQDILARYYPTARLRRLY